MRKLVQLVKGQPDEDILDLLKHNIIGTPGKSLVYQHLKVGEKIRFIKKCVFPVIRIANKAIGTACFISRQVQISGKLISATYIRYFSFKTAFRSTSQPLNRISKSSTLKKEISAILDANSEHPDQNQITYAYVDPGNIRSKRIIEGFGFSQIGTFNTVFYSRFYPSKNLNVRNIDFNLVSDKIDRYYAHHALFSKDNLGYQDGYWVYVHNGQIIGGLQANAENWLVHEIPGGKHLISLVSNLPFINKLFNSNFRFLSLEGVFFEDGFEWSIPLLIDHVMKSKNRNTAIICIDPKCRLYSVFEKMDRGFIKKLTSEKSMAVMVRASDSIKNALLDKSLYISSFDNM